jgi:putative tricarboxylic transport membrane protein
VLVFGLIGYAMKRLGFPTAPLVLGLVLGPLFEKALVQTSSIGDGNLLIVFSRPLCVVVLALAALLLVGPSVVTRLRSRNKATNGTLVG